VSDEELSGPPNGSDERLPRNAPRFVSRISACPPFTCWGAYPFLGPFAVRAVGVDDGSTCRPIQFDDAIRHLSDRDIPPWWGIVGLVMLSAMMDRGYQGGQLVGCHRLRKDAVVSA
jgi:hypothetical protein